MKENSSFRVSVLISSTHRVSLWARYKKLTFAFWLGLVLSLATIPSVNAQITSFPELVNQFREHQRQVVQEKIFLHIDRQAYVSGERLWFKIYTVEGTHHHLYDLSKVAYVEVLDATKKQLLQGKISLKAGKGNGSFDIPAQTEAGTYVVRAYTNWMKNFSPEFYYEQPITIINTFQPLSVSSSKDTTSYALQFFPEGGNLLQGIRSKVAFKGANHKTGKGAAFEGEVVDQTGNVIAQFKPSKLGIGSFFFTPTSTGEFTAIVRFATGQVIRQKLPQVQDQGHSLQLQEIRPGTIQITAHTTHRQQEQLYLLGHTRQKVVVAAMATLSNGQANFIVAKDSLAVGITHFTLFNKDQKPVAERLFFKRPTEELDIETTLTSTQIGTREKVTLNVVTQHQNKLAIPANLSLAVYRADSLSSADLADIRAYLWLSSDLSGTIENAASYFSETGPAAQEALDNLMLTHGWSRFTWQQVLSPKPMEFPFLPEYDGHFIRGKVTHNDTGAPASRIRTYLASPGKNVRFYSNTSTQDGTVWFETKDFFGSKEVVVQSDFRKDSTYHFELFSPFSEKHSKNQLPGFSLKETLKDALQLRHQDVQAQAIFHEKQLLKVRPPGIDSLPFYGKPNQHYLLDDYTRFKVLEEVMREYVPGVMVRKRRNSFHFLVLDGLRGQFLQEDPLVLLDGVPMFDLDKLMAFDPLKLQKLDVMTGNYYNGALSSSGIVSFTTYKGDLAAFPVDPRALMQEYEGLLLQRAFFAPAYASEEQKLSRLPDWRNLLHWVPDLQTDGTGKASTTFYTSDLPSTYRVVVQGLTANGLPGFKTFTFEVKKAL